MQIQFGVMALLMVGGSAFATDQSVHNFAPTYVTCTSDKNGYFGRAAGAAGEGGGEIDLVIEGKESSYVNAMCGALKYAKAYQSTVELKGKWTQGDDSEYFAVSSVTFEKQASQ